MSNELKVELSCGRCNFTKVISIGVDADGVFTIPNKFCPNDLNELSREVLRNFVSVPKSDEPTENKTRTSNAVSKPARPVDLPKYGPGSSKKT